MKRIARCWYVARKYFWMNPAKLWWITHTVDEWNRERTSNEWKRREN